MAIPISEEELQLKKRARRRLIGAIALVTVVAVFLPMVLDHEPKPVSQDISIQIPSQNAGTFTSKIVPVVPGSAESKGAPVPDAPSAAPLTPPPTPPKVATAPAMPATPPAGRDSEAAPAKAAGAESKPPAAEPKPKVKAPLSTDTEAAPQKPAVAEAKPKSKVKPAGKAEGRDNGGFVVQVAALTDADKARQMREQIAAAGVKAYTEVVPTTKGDVTRVRAGPFASREAAEKARDSLKDMGLAGNVVPK